jgi:hypothetical protein
MFRASPWGLEQTVTVLDEAREKALDEIKATTDPDRAHWLAKEIYHVTRYMLWCIEYRDPWLLGMRVVVCPAAVEKDLEPLSTERRTSESRRGPRSDRV